MRISDWSSDVCSSDLSQVDGSPERTLASARPIGETAASAKLFLESVGVPVHYGPWDAYFRPDEDRVYMPDREAFDSDEDFISTLGHEIVHSPGSAQRLARETLRDYFKDRDRSSTRLNSSH